LKLNSLNIIFEQIIATNKPNMYASSVPMAAPFIPSNGINKYENTIFKMAIEKVSEESILVFLKK
tara:strand:+ start:346 stop:540 length:195 start_codon:yes stop_codon:yes gene_type:complete